MTLKAGCWPRRTRAEYLYLGNEPLALSRSGQLYYYHNDHLGTPQKLTDGAGQVVWSASYRAFGEASIGAGYVAQNLRFPGQYYDEESGLHYNYQRYYDPQLGRYITSDPIGFAGGINTYGYALQNPIMYYDPNGEDPASATATWGAYTGALGTDLAVPEPSDAIPYKWGAWAIAGVVAAGTAAYLYCQDSADEDCEKADDECFEECEYLLGQGGRTNQGFPYRNCWIRCMKGKGCYEGDSPVE